MVRGDETPTVLQDRPIDRLVQPVQAFLAHPLAGAFLLLGAALLALVFANTPWHARYHALLHTEISIAIGPWHLGKSSLHWVNDGLMGIFFFLVGLEIKRELLVGELSTLRQATLPAVAAVGGMAVPAAIYYLLNRGEATVVGWGIPMATDIAFALGILALVRHHVPVGLKVFLSALAIVDDIGAVLVIALFYTDHLALASLGAGGLIFSACVVANRLRVRSPLIYLIIGLLMWLAFLQSGVHATIAALLVSFVIPARTRLDGSEFNENMQAHLADLHAAGLPEDHALNSKEQQQVLESIANTIALASAPLQRLEHSLAPVATYCVLPLFALANAGVTLPEDLTSVWTSAESLGIALGLFVGKPVGITLCSWFAVRIGVAELPNGVSFRHVLGTSWLAGIGFTMSLFIAGLAFPTAARLDQAKLGILLGSLASGTLGFIWLRYCGPASSKSLA